MIEEKNELGPEVELGPDKQCNQAQQHDELIAELLDSRRLKTEREHAAAREIERLRESLQDLAKYFTSGNSVPVERAAILAKDFWRITGRLITYEGN